MRIRRAGHYPDIVGVMGMGSWNDGCAKDRASCDRNTGIGSFDKSRKEEEGFDNVRELALRLVEQVPIELQDKVSNEVRQVEKRITP